MRSLAIIAVALMVGLTACANTDGPETVETTTTDSAVVLAQDGTEFVVDVTHPGPLTGEAVQGIASSIEIVNDGQDPLGGEPVYTSEGRTMNDVMNGLIERGVQISVRPNTRFDVLEDYSWRFIANPTHHVDDCPGM